MTEKTIIRDGRTLTLYATEPAESNWDIYRDTENGILYYIARPGSGAGSGVFGPPDYIIRRQRGGEFLDFTIVAADA